MPSVAVPDVDKSMVTAAYVLPDNVAVKVASESSSAKLVSFVARVTVGALYASTILIVVD